MERSWYWRVFFIVALIVVSLYAAAPSFIYLMSPSEVRRSRTELAKEIPEWLPAARINMGIDLSGGLHLVMGVDTDKAAVNRADREADAIAEAMKDKEHPVANVSRMGEAPRLKIELKDKKDMDTLREILELRKDVWVTQAQSDTSVEIAMREDRIGLFKEDAVEQALKTLRNRIEEYSSLTEPEVRKSGSNSILIQLAGVTAEDTQHVKEDIIGRTAQLEFKMVDDESKYFSDVATNLPEGISLGFDGYQGPGDSRVTSPYLMSAKKSDLVAFVAQHPPPSDRVVRYSKIQDEGVDKWRTWLLDRRTPLTGDSIVHAFPSFDPDKAETYVALKLDHAGGAVFDQLTAQNVRKRVAIVLDDMVDSAPVIQQRIPNGNVSITLGNSPNVRKDAEALSVVLNAGSLPAPVFPAEERTVGATLGDDAIAKGKWAMIASLIIVVLTMLGYYRLCGAISIVALAVNMLLLFAGLSAFRATLTLPGIAGLALTIGMAVDANIIQFERIREELRLGKTVRTAVQSGFDKAFSAIFDSNVTTFLSGVVLYQYGSGPIRGFATTLMLGVFINTFTAVIVPRLFLEYLAKARRVQELSI